MSFNISNNAGIDLTGLMDLAQELLSFSQEKVGWKRPPTLRLDSDSENAENPLGKTAHYNPETFEIVILVDKRHPKDILRSLSHELVHHFQNERGDFDRELETGAGYAQKDPHLREMEREAYETGNLCFRDWEDGKKELNESIYYTKPILGGEEDMSNDTKKPLKEWKNEEINFRLMKKFGLLKETEVDGGGAEQLYHEDTTDEKTNLDEDEGGDDEDPESTEDAQEEHPFGYDIRDKHKPSLNKIMLEGKTQQIYEEEFEKLLQEDLLQELLADPTLGSRPSPVPPPTRRRKPRLQKVVTPASLRRSPEQIAAEKAAAERAAVEAGMTDVPGSPDYITPAQRLARARVPVKRATPGPTWFDELGKTGADITRGVGRAAEWTGGLLHDVFGEPDRPYAYVFPEKREIRPYSPRAWDPRIDHGPEYPTDWAQVKDPETGKLTWRSKETKPYYEQGHIDPFSGETVPIDLSDTAMTGEGWVSIPGWDPGTGEVLRVAPPEEFVRATPAGTPSIETQEAWGKSFPKIPPKPVEYGEEAPDVETDLAMALAEVALTLYAPGIVPKGAKIPKGKVQVRIPRTQADVPLGPAGESGVLSRTTKPGTPEVNLLRADDLIPNAKNALQNMDPEDLGKLIDWEAAGRPGPKDPLWKTLPKITQATVLRSLKTITTPVRPWAWDWKRTFSREFFFDPRKPWVAPKKASKLKPLQPGEKLPVSLGEKTRSAAYNTLRTVGLAGTLTAAALETKRKFGEYYGDETGLEAIEERLENRLVWVWNPQTQQYFDPNRPHIEITDQNDPAYHPAGRIIGYYMGDALVTGQPEENMYSDAMHPCLKNYDGSPYIYSNAQPPAPLSKEDMAKCVEKHGKETAYMAWAPYGSRQEAVQMGTIESFWYSSVGGWLLNKVAPDMGLGESDVAKLIKKAKKARTTGAQGTFVLSPWMRGERDIMDIIPGADTPEGYKIGSIGGEVSANPTIDIGDEVIDIIYQNGQYVNQERINKLICNGPADSDVKEIKDCWSRLPKFTGKARWSHLQNFSGLGVRPSNIKAEDWGIKWTFPEYLASKVGSSADLGAIENLSIPFGLGGPEDRPIFTHPTMRNIIDVERDPETGEVIDAGLRLPFTSGRWLDSVDFPPDSWKGDQMRLPDLNWVSPELGARMIAPENPFVDIRSEEDFVDATLISIMNESGNYNIKNPKAFVQTQEFKDFKSITYDDWKVHSQSALARLAATKGVTNTQYAKAKRYNFIHYLNDLVTKQQKVTETVVDPTTGREEDVTLTAPGRTGMIATDQSQFERDPRDPLAPARITGGSSEEVQVQFIIIGTENEPSEVCTEETPCKRWVGKDQLPPHLDAFERHPTIKGLWQIKRSNINKLDSEYLNWLKTPIEMLKKQKNKLQYGFIPSPSEIRTGRATAPGKRDWDKSIKTSWKD